MLIAFDVSVNQTQVVEAEKNAQKLIHTFKRVAEVAAVALGVHFAEAIAEQADQYTELANKLRTVTQSNEEFEAAQRGVFRIARETYEPVNDVVDTYKRLRFATEELGLSQDDTLSFTKSLTQAIKLSGTDAVETQAAMRELTHGLTTNFEGSSRELRALQKNAPLLAKLVAESLGKTAKEFVELGKEGKITSDVFVQALLKAGPELDKLFKKRVPLFADLKTNLWNDWLSLLKQLTPALDSIKVVLGEVVEWVHRWVEDGSAMNSVIAALIVGVGTLAVAFAPFVLELIAAVAPFAALFLLVEDFVTFLRGGKSVLGDALGPEKAEKFRQGLEQAWDIAKKLFAFLQDPSQVNWETFYNTAVVWIDKLFAHISAKLAEMKAAIAEAKDTFVFGERGSVVREFVERRRSEDVQKNAAVSAALDAAATDASPTLQKVDAGIKEGAAFVGDAALRTPGALWDSFMGLTNWTKGWAGRAGDAVFGGTPTLPAQAVNNSYSPTVNGASPQINNTITVQGNADANTAREIASQTGRATAAALGRDRSAVGVGVGIQP